MSAELLHTYMQDHHTGAAAGLDLFHRVAAGHSDPEIRAVISRLADETEQDKHSLERLMTLVGAKPSALKILTARVGEKLARFKPNQRLRDRSPLSDLIELEALTLAVRGRELGMKALLDIEDPRLPRESLQTLVERAVDHGTTLDELRLRCTNALKKN